MADRVEAVAIEGLGAVNLAARAQSEAHGGEVVATSAIFDDLTDEQVLEVPYEHFDVQPRGLSAPVRMVRITCNNAPGAVQLDSTIR